MIVETFPAMGTTIAVTTDRDDGVERTRAMFATVERTCSRFLADSELSRLNVDPSPRRQVSAVLAAALRTALELRDRTDGLVDPRLGDDVSAWGYDRTFSQVHDLDTAPTRPVVPLGEVALHDRTLLRSRHVSIDLGGTAKGWTVDRAIGAGYARVVNAGGDVRSTDDRTLVHLDDPWGGVAATVHLGVGALATSSTALRRWKVAGREAHHLIHPWTRQPVASPVVSATCLAETAAEADAAAKAVLLQGEHGLEWARNAAWVRSALVVWHDGSVFGTEELQEVLV